MFRIKLENTVFESSGEGVPTSGGTSTGGLSRLIIETDGDNVDIGEDSVNLNLSNNLIILDASDDSPEFYKFSDILINPCKYKGKIVYISNIGPTPRPEPFLYANKFYFNEDCIWTINTSPLAVQAVSGNLGSINENVENVKTIQFDNNTGFRVTNNGEGKVFIDLGSHFADIFVDGQQTLEAEGEDKLQIIAGYGIELTTTTAHTGSAPKALIITAAKQDKNEIIVLDATDDSPDLPKFLDLIENPLNYKGKIAYITDIGPTPRPDPFLWKDKFYFNEAGEWFESPFAIGGMLNG